MQENAIAKHWFLESRWNSGEEQIINYLSHGETAVWLTGLIYGIKTEYAWQKNSAKIILKWPSRSGVKTHLWSAPFCRQAPGHTCSTSSCTMVTRLQHGFSQWQKSTFAFIFKPVEERQSLMRSLQHPLKRHHLAIWYSLHQMVLHVTYYSVCWRLNYLLSLNCCLKWSVCHVHF